MKSIEKQKKVKTLELKPKKLAASFLAVNALSMSFPLNVLAASNITDVTPTTADNISTFNIEAAKVSGATGFRQYADFTLDKGDIANLVFKDGQQNFVNLVDNQVNINGILNTMQNNAFYNGHAIFVSPAGMIIGASGVLNVGSLTMMAPSQNAYNAFKNGLTANDYKNIEDYKFDLNNANYKSLITNSSGSITINGKIFARNSVEAYARTINIAKSSGEGATEPGIFAGIKDKNELIKTNAAADALFKELVKNNITNADSFNLEDGKIKLVTNRAQNEVITTVFTSEETVKKEQGTGTDTPANNNDGGDVEKKKYETTTTINVANGLKTVVKKEIKEDDSGESKTETSIDDKIYEESSLSDSNSSISISDANIAANEVEIEAKAELTKKVTEESIKTYGEAAKKAESTSSSGSSGSGGDSGSSTSNDGGSSGSSSGSGSTSGSSGTEEDSTSGYKIHKSSMGMADEAKTSIEIEDSKIQADTISITSNAKSDTKTYIQLTKPIWEKWIESFGKDALMRVVPKLLAKIDGENADMYTMIGDAIDSLPWESKAALFSYFSDKMYTYYEGARANSNISVVGSEIKAATSVDITSNADAVLNLTTGNLDSHAFLLYGLGSGTESKVNVSGSTISATNLLGTGIVNINAFSSIDHSIDYDSSNFRTIIDNNGSTKGYASGYNFSLLNNSISSNNNVTIKDGILGDKSKIEADKVDVKAIGFNKSDINIKNVSNVGENAERSGISMSMLINHTDTNTNILVKNSDIKVNGSPVDSQEIDWDKTTDISKPVMKDVTYDYGTARFIAENIESIKNKVTTEVQAKKREYTINTKEMANFSPTYTIKLYDWLNKKFLSKASDKVGGLIDKAKLEFSGSAIWNDEINKSSSILDGTTVTADKLNVYSNILDFNTNYAVADAAANSKLGGGAAIIVNSRNNTNNAKIINDSKINVATTVNVDAQTQLPMNPLTLKVGTRQDGKDYYIGASFDEGDGTDKWDTEFLYSGLMNLLGVIGNNLNKEGFQKFLKGVKSPKKTIGNLQIDMDGLLNNYAKAQTGGQYSGIAGSVIVNTIKNDTTALIDSSTVTAKEKNVLVNAVNSTVNNDGAGKVEFMVTEINDFLSKLKGGTPEQQLEASKFGMGGSVLVQNFTNNTTASINKSKITAEKGNVDVLSSSEEGYINIAMTGAKAKNVAIEGSVSVQNLKGTTKASIEDEENNENLIKAKNVNVKAGSAKARTKKKGSGSALFGVAGESLVQDSDSHELERNEARESKDKVLNITIFGTNAMNSGTGVSVGSSVNVASNNKQVNSLVEKANITASDNIDVSANLADKKIDVLTSGAFTGGVKTTNLPNVGNSQDGSTSSITNDANSSTNQSLTGHQSVLDGNNPNREGAQSSECTTGGATELASGVANILTGNNTSASSNFSASLAGTVEVYNDKSAVTAAIKNAVLNVGDKLNATAEKDNFLLNVSGGVAKGNSIGGGAAVNIYSNSGIVSSDITGSTITFNSNNAKNMNVKATSNHFIVDVAMGVGIAGSSNVGGAVGGSFNTNTLKDTTSAKITNTTVSKKSDVQNDIDVNVAANTESKIYNVAGTVGYKNSGSIALGAGVAGNMDVLEQAVLSQITGKSTLNNAKDVIVDSILKQHIKSIAIAGEVVSSDTFSFNIGGALGLELIKNNISAILGGDSSNLTTINSSGNVRVKAESVIDGFTSTGALNVTKSSASFGTGIGAIVDIDSSEVKAKVDNAKVEKSKSVTIKASSSDKRDFIAANLGVQYSDKGSLGITANGIVSVLKSQIHSQVLNGSKLNSDGTININSSYDNNFKGVTAVGEGAKKGGAIGANVLVNHFENDVLSEISNDSILNAGENVGITARTAATLNLIPAAVSFAAAGVTALTADVSVDIIKDKTQALAKAKEITSQSGNITVGADDETTMLNRGGTVSGATPATFTAISGAVNVDKIEKTVNAQIGTNEQGANKSVVTANNGTVSVSSVSTNSIGGTKNKDGLYERDNIFSQEYQDKLLTKDSDGNFKGINYSSGFGNWNMFYNIAAGSHTTIAGTVIVKNIQNNINAKVLNTKLKSNDLNITSTDYSVKNIVAGEISAAAIAAVGAQVYITKDNSNTYSIISNSSDIEVANTININAWNRKDNKLVFAAAGGSGLGSANTNVLKNTIKDDTIAKVESGSTVKAGTLNINTEEDVNASRIVVAASGSAGLAIDVSPLINYYGDDSTNADRKGKIISEISASTVNNAAINMNASTNIRTQDIVIDAGGAGTGFVGIGSVIKNTYNTVTKSIIDSNSTVNTAKDIKMDANSFYDSRNYAIGASGMITGANFVANVILNDFISKTESSIENSSIIAKSIELNTNKNKRDNLVNYGIAGGFAVQGVSAIVTTIYDVFNNESIAKVANSNITANAGGLKLDANSARAMKNYDISASAAGLGFGGAASALVTKNDSKTLSYIDAKSDNKIDIAGQLRLNAQDTTIADNTLGVGGGGAGAAIACVNLYTSNSLVKSEILSQSANPIKSGSAYINSETTNAIRNLSVGAAAGLASIAADVQIVKIGKFGSSYTDTEEKSSIKAAIQKIKENYDKITTDEEKARYNPEADTTQSVTGAIANINADMVNTGTLEMNSKSNVKGVDKDGKLTDKLYLKNVDVSVGGAAAHAAVKNIKLANDTKSTISGGSVKSGDITINAESNSNVEIESTGVSVSGASLSGGSSIYGNNSNTLAQIGSNGADNTTITADNVSVNSKSTSKSNLITRSVGVTGAGVAGVNIIENIDKNSSLAKITGNTNITANNDLSVHSTINTDLYSRQNTVEVRGADIASVFKNETNASTISKAVIEAVNGTIKSKNISLISDYGVMKIENTVDATKVKAVNIVDHDTAKVIMNSTFTSGIYDVQNEKAVAAQNTKIYNSGNLKIETAKNTGNQGISAVNTLDEVNATIANFFSGTFGETQNTSKSNTYLMVGENKTGSLTINSYLDSLAKTTTGVRKGGAISVNSAYAESYDTSTLNLNIAGTNKVTGNAVINAIHNANVSSDLEALNVGVGVQGQRVRISANQTADTLGTIAGDYSANSSDININTNRNSYISKTTKSGGTISVNDAKSNNTLKGNSKLDINIDNVSDVDLKNKMTVKNTSTNTFDIKSSDSSGGIINISSINDNTTLNTNTVTNVTNAKIKSKDEVSFEVSNNTLVDDTGTSKGGGFIAVLDTEYTRHYSSSANLNLKDTKIHAKDIKLNTHSDISAKRKNEFDFKAGGGGFVAVPKLTLRNYLNQTSSIDLKNTILDATNDAVLSTDTSSWFKVKSNADGRGFVSVPKVWSYLDPTYNQTITLDNKSIINAAHNAVFNFNSSNTLSSKVSVYAANFAGPPSAYSWLTLNINNKLDNNGTIKAGNLADINYMTNSNNDLTNDIEIENRASVAKTWEDGRIYRRVSNELIVPEKAQITSNKDVEVTYGAGKTQFNSRKKWTTISYIVFGIPIEKSKTTYPVDNIVNNSLKLNGLIKAGTSGSKKVVINKNGDINFDLSEGLDTNDYSLTGGRATDGKTVKDRKITELQDQIDKATSDQKFIDTEIENIGKSIEVDTEEWLTAKGILSDFQELVDGNYILLNTYVSDNQETSEFYSFIVNDFKTQIVGSESYELSEAQYNALIKAYSSEINEIYEYNKTHEGSPKEIITINDFLDKNTNLGLSDIQKNTVITAYNILESNNSKGGLTQYGNFQTYVSFAGNKYAGVSNPTVVNGVKSCDELKVTDPNNPGTKIELATRIKQLDANINSLAETLENYTNTSLDLFLDISALNIQKEVVENTPEAAFARMKDTSYSIVFNDIKTQESNIKIDGMSNRNIEGNGNFIISGSGLRVDNYSTRSLIFNDIDIGAGSDGSLFIGGRDYYEFANADQAVNGKFADLYMGMGPSLSWVPFTGVGTEGAHYQKTGIGEKPGIVINNYYDSANPFAANESSGVANYFMTSDIKFNGNIVSNGVLNVFNDSGSISFGNFNADKIKDDIDIIATKGNVDFTSLGAIKLNSGNNIFAGNSVNINAKSLNSKANITAGYNKDLTLTVTDDMLLADNLITDPVTGEKILVNLGNTPYNNANNNIKVLYKDNQIHLFNVNNEIKELDRSQRGKVNINVTESNNTIYKDKITAYDKYQKITVDNKTDKQLNVYDVTNSKSTGGYYLNGNLEKDALGYLKAETSITSKGKLSIGGVIKNALTYNNQGKHILDTSTDALQSALLIYSNGNGLEVKAQKPYLDTTGSVSTSSIFAEGTVALYNDDDLSQTGDTELTSNMDINGDIEVQGDVAIVQDTKGTLTVNAELHQLKHADSDVDDNGNRTKGNILIVNNNTEAGGVYVKENTFLHNEDGNITIGSKSSSEVKVDGVLYAKGGAISIYNAGGPIQYSATAVADEHILDNNGTAPITVSGILVATNGNIEVENEKGDFEITEHGSLINLSETPQNINILNTAAGNNLTIKGTVENYSGGDITVTNQGAGDALISGLIYNEKGSVVIDNKKNNLTVSGDVSTDNGRVIIANFGKKAEISGNIVAQSDDTLGNWVNDDYDGNNSSVDTEVNKGGIFIVNKPSMNSTPGEQNLKISGGFYLNYLDNTKGGKISIFSAQDAGALNFENSYIDSQGTDTQIFITNDSVNSGLTVDKSIISQKDGSVSIKSNKNDLSIKATSIETNNKGINIFGVANTNIDANIKYSNNGTNQSDGININYENLSGAVNNFVLDGIIQSENAYTSIDLNNNYDGNNAAIKSDIITYAGNTNINNSRLHLDVSSDILNTGGNLNLKNIYNGSSPANTDGLNISGSMVNVDGDINILSNYGALNIDEDAYIYNISSEEDNTVRNLNITNSGKGLDLNGSIGNTNGNVNITNTAKSAANIMGNIGTVNGDIAITNSNDGALNVSGYIENEKGKIEITNNSSDGMIIDYGANILNYDTSNTVITNTQGSALIENGAKIINTQGGDISVANSGIGLAIQGLIENQGTGKITVDNGSGNLNVNKTAILSTISGNINVANRGNIANIAGNINSTKGVISISNENDGALNVIGDVTTDNGIITITNNSIDGMIIHSDAGILNNDTANTVITNTQGSALIESGAKIVNANGGDIFVANSGVELAIQGLIENQGTGIITINNSGANKLDIVDSAIIHTIDGKIGITSNKGIDLTGLIQADKQNIEITNSNGDLKIGSYEDNNNNYITTLNGDITVNQTQGSILNSIVDTVLGNNRQNYDQGNINPSYKTLISSNGDITFNVTNGNIGSYSNTEIAAGTSYDASTRDFTESINVQSKGKVSATVVNNGDGLVNIRAKQSDLKVGTIKSDGNVLLTAADWKQADVRPVNKSDKEYFNGYSMLNGNDDNSSNIIAKNISLITSGSFGSFVKKLIYELDTLNAGENVSISAEAENGLHLTGRTNSNGADIKIKDIISKHGSVDIEFESDAEIEQIAAGDELLITQKAQNLTIKEFGTSRSSAALNFNDMLYPHDDIALDGSSTELLIPKYVDIRVLDAISNPDSSNATLKIYTGYVRGNNGDNAHYYPNDARRADITLMADYIYAMSDKMQSPTFSDRIDLGNTNITYEIDGETRTAKGLNAYGDGSTLTLDIFGVDKDFVNTSGAVNRNSYNSQVSVSGVPSKFQNNVDEIPYYGSDYSAKNVILSVNDYSSREVNFDTLYTDNAFISVNKDNLNFDNAYVNNFAEIKTNNKTAVVDNERIGRLENTDIQLYTKKTGSFALGLDRTINMQTTAPTVYNNPHMLVNGYHSAWNFVNRGFKETQVMLNNIPETIHEKLENELRTSKPMMVVFDVAGNLADLSSDTKIYSMSTTGALIANNKGLKNGDKTQLNVKIDDMDIVIEAKVINAEDDVAQVEFINLPRSLANKLLYRYMQASSEDINLTAL